MNLRYSEFLLKLSSYVSTHEPYLCCHLEGFYLEPGYCTKTEEYTELIISPAHKKHRTRLKTTITCKMKNYNKLRGDAITTLTIPLREQNLDRVRWLQYLSELAEIKESKGK